MKGHCKVEENAKGTDFKESQESYWDAYSSFLMDIMAQLRIFKGIFLEIFLFKLWKS